MLFSTRRLVVAATLAGALVPATSAARPIAVTRQAHPHGRNSRPGCEKTFTVAMFRRAARATYAGYRVPSRADLAHLRRYEHCARHVRYRPADHRTWAINQRANKARKDALTPYGEWAVPATIVWCESNDRNLPPNSAGASGYYQIIPSTWAGYGGLAYAGEAYESSKLGQDIVAGRIYNGGAGAGQWVCRA